jgi:anti-sigma regulatory factor (Ser/Thr protein kinase)
MPTVDISFAALPAHVRTARLIAVAVARRAHVADELLDELRLAVGEACSRAVALHQQYARDRLVQMLLSDDEGGFSVEVVDAGPPDDAPPMEALALAANAVPAPRDDAGLDPRSDIAGPDPRSDIAGPDPRSDIAGPDPRSDLVGPASLLSPFPDTGPVGAGPGTSAGTAESVDPLREVLPPGFRLAVIAGLVEDVEVVAGSPTGTRVRMSWPAGAQAGESLAASG